MSWTFALSSLIEKYFIRAVATNNKQIEKTKIGLKDQIWNATMYQLICMYLLQIL